MGQSFVGLRLSILVCLDFGFVFTRQIRQSRHVQQKWVWQTISSWSQFATLNDDEEESETRRLGTGGAFDPRSAG